MCDAIQIEDAVLVERIERINARTTVEIFDLTRREGQIVGRMINIRHRVAASIVSEDKGQINGNRPGDKRDRISAVVVEVIREIPIIGIEADRV